ncbi:hypothetical protein CTAM01_00542 [Colletotrichum tamarilloi]|uniref:Uncharacterized protein n=1 Tax=Colletotrichum tamarilloi TaxID=1209934 RepID=A0ABQ9RUV9_9PEZI|nr:uncharacterized protein CTAM01_00542 [Colletotrichum tamarilloi]KAK1513146.1 hypothetical protein CTAM01_00542 [Colletotrichum tamarilloi]
MAPTANGVYGLPLHNRLFSLEQVGAHWSRRLEAWSTQKNPRKTFPANNPGSRFFLLLRVGVSFSNLEFSNPYRQPHLSIPVHRSQHAPILQVENDRAFQWAPPPTLPPGPATICPVLDQASLLGPLTKGSGLKETF